MGVLPGLEGGGVGGDDLTGLARDGGEDAGVSDLGDVEVGLRGEGGGLGGEVVDDGGVRHPDGGAGGLVAGLEGVVAGAAEDTGEGAGHFECHCAGGGGGSEEELGLHFGRCLKCLCLSREARV